MEWTLILNNLVGFAITIFMGWFAWESTLLVHERNKKRREIFDKSKIKYRDGDNT